VNPDPEREKLFSRAYDAFLSLTQIVRIALIARMIRRI